LVFKKRKAHAIFKNTKNPDDYQSFFLLRAQYKYMSKQFYRSFIRTTESTFNSNPSKFWEFVRKNRSSQSIPKTVKLNGAASKNINDVASLFSKHFNSVYSNSHVDYVPSSVSNLLHDLPSNCLFELRQVENGLAKLKNNKSISPDGLSGVFLYAIRSSLCLQKP